MFIFCFKVIGFKLFYNKLKEVQNARPAHQTKIIDYSKKSLRILRRLFLEERIDQRLRKERKKEANKVFTESKTFENGKVTYERNYRG